MKNLKYQNYELKYKDFPLEYNLIKGLNALSHDYSKDYLTFEALEDGTISFNIESSMDMDLITSISYSIDNGKTWITTNNQNDKSENLVISVNVTAGDKILWKGVAKQFGWHPPIASKFSSTCKFNASGNIMSLLYGDEFDGKTKFSENSSYQFFYLFKESGITDASNLILSATTLTEYCYSSMFDGCTSLTVAPELPANTLARYCYASMFYRCISLVNVPKLPATTLTTSCYQSMFNGCTSLVTAPELPATTLASSCYFMIFTGCTSLNYIKAMFTTTPTNTYTQNWVSGVSPTGTFVKNSAATWDVTGTNGIPEGWTVETADATN